MRYVAIGLIGVALGAGFMAVHEKRSIASLQNTCIESIRKVETTSLDGIKQAESHSLIKINELRDYCLSLIRPAHHD